MGSGRIDEQLATIALFAACDRRERAEIVRLTTTVDVEAGKVLAEEGRLGLEFVVILDGEATVRKGGEEVARLRPGDYFGEIALLDEAHVRTASVVAETDMRLAVLDRREFSQLLDEHPAITRRLLTGLARIAASQLEPH